MADLEKIPPGEAASIAEIMRLTLEQIKRRYPGDMHPLRGVHAKDHGCVQAAFKVRDDLPPEHQVGVFAKPGHTYQAWVRFSNADVVPKPDTQTEKNGTLSHGSRGMAIKLLDVPGTPLPFGIPSQDFSPDSPFAAPFGIPSQDFLMVNQPVFAFANVEDYLALSKVLQEDKDEAGRFFTRIKFVAGPNNTKIPDPNDAVSVRAFRTLGIVKAIQAATFQPAPASPVDNDYFSAAPFLFGEDRVMKFSAKPLSRSTAAPILTDGDDYLRKALRERLKPGNPAVVFSFQVQLRTAKELEGKIETEIEDACVLWTGEFKELATLTIPAQDFEAPRRRALCENLFFTPWHGLVDHRPLGGINRLRKSVYEASALLRHLPKEPARWC